jgi:rhamnose utilization protein RhaD (predicted bifunctional aldolase and dehydrogenase)
MEAGKKLHIVETKRYQPYGTLELVKEVMKILDKNNYIILKNGGIVALGKTIKEAGERVLETHKNAKKILISKALL